MISGSLVVVNRHHFKGTYPNDEVFIYVGRPGRVADEEIARGCLDGTAFGNPFRIGKGTPLDEILGRYKRWLWNHGPIEALCDIPEGARLVCSCKPRPCHGDVIAAAWKWSRSAEGERSSEA